MADVVDLYKSTYNSVFSNGSDVFPTSFEWSGKFYTAPSIFTGSDSSLVDSVLNNEFLLKTVTWQAMDIPDAQMNTVNIRGHRYSQPGMAQNSGVVTFTVMDNVNMNLHKYFTAVEYAMDDPMTHTSQYRNPAGLYFGFYITKLNPMGAPIARWNCPRALLSQVGTDINSGNSNKDIQGRLTVSFTVDLFKIYYPNSDGKFDDPDDGSPAWGTSSAKKTLKTSRSAR